MCASGIVYWAHHVSPQVKKAQVMYDPHSRESRGFGFVTMESVEEADAAITAMNGAEIMGKVISVQRVSSSIKFMGAVF